MNGLLTLFLASVCLAQDFDGRAAKPAKMELPPAAAEAPAGKPAALKTAERPQNVILITWDGVRSEDFFGNRPDPLLEKTDTAPLLPRFWSRLAAEGTVWGTPGAAGSFGISNLAGVSLPGYQSIMAGSLQPCMNNNCGRIKVETFPERLVRELGLPPEKVVVVSGWNGVPLAVEHTQGTLSVNGPTSAGTRPDTETWPLGLQALAQRPRFLYIALNDSDDLGHAGDYPGYVARLRLYDQWLDELLQTLAGMGDYGADTTVLLTTDHGRGLGEDWKNHNSLRPSATKIFLYARGPKVSRGIKGAGKRAHADLRPTIETLLGLEPFTCDYCGAALPEVVGAPAASSP